MGKIATKRYCNSVASNSFSSDLNNCPTLTEIIAVDNLYVLNSSNYEINQCVQVDDLVSYTFTASNTTISFSGSGGTINITITSKAGDTVIGWEIYSKPASFTVTKSSQTQLTVKATNNTTTSTKGGSIQLQQAGSGKILGITVTQAAGVRTYSYSIAYNSPVNLSDSKTDQNVTITASKHTKWNGVTTDTQSGISCGITSATISTANNLQNYVHVNFSGNVLRFTRRLKPNSMVSGSCSVTARCESTANASTTVGISCS